MNFPLVFIFTLQRKSASGVDYATISKHDFVCLWLLLAKKLLISKAAKENNILLCTVLCYDLKMTIHTAHPE